MSLSGSELTLAVPDALIEEIAERAALIALAQLSKGIFGSPYLTVNEAAERLRAKQQRVYDLLSSGRLTRFKDGNRVLLSLSEIDAYLAGTSESPIAPRLPHALKSRSTRGLSA